MITELPSMNHVFTIDLKGSETGRQFQGTFTYKRPNIRMQSEIAKTAAVLNGGIQGVDEDTIFLHGILATLKHTLIESPDWWKKEDYGYELYDMNVILEIYKSIKKFEEEWMNKVWADNSDKKDNKQKK